jgi:hypothetical protein
MTKLQQVNKIVIKMLNKLEDPPQMWLELYQYTTLIDYEYYLTHI